MGEKKGGNLIMVVIWSLIMVFMVIEGQELPLGKAGLIPAVALVDSGLANVSNMISSEMEESVPFCIVDGRKDWDRAFNYTDLTFLTDCMRENQDIAQRLCSAAEIKSYMSNYLTRRGSGGGPNKNCNTSSSSWVPGCEPGWACSTGPNVEVDLQNSKDIPSRTANCKRCCEGFFCPQGLTCMLPCPLGASCPLATFNEDTGLCDPYNYQLPSGRNHTCGGANVWADIVSSREVFCPAGSYCPSTTEKIQCDSGYYCRVGSTEQTRCSKLISCDSGTDKQNIRTYGIMVIVGLVALLLLIYNCTDQILALRERRHATSRERAASSVQQRERALARWKNAKEAAKKHAAGLQATLSRKFSRRRQSDQIRVFDGNDIEADHFLLSSNPPSSDVSPVLESDGELKGCDNAIEKTHVLGGKPPNHKGLALEIEEKSTKRKMPKEKNTETQIFKNAYAQIEKEKSQDMHYENLTFSGVISMATCSDGRKRPLIEIAFKDLTLTLKGKKKCLLKSLTGRIVPGRIAAVMGPSGAGKTTFLSALAGKATGCNRSGSIFINGKPKSILSYRKIIGFVPQDDIVHGNLTVEENLWFSAHCRLSANLPRAEKVLIVERVIANLGLQEVRDSLVGTVEKRGISGGQRKRVNVGLEMVMEPSLIFLDEPTSGLDSSSSRLLLRALKHEAHAGVNICMVVHQPSYALFKMFDDLILLAKGGLMVYNGSVRMVEEYFGGLGIHVPERINPPDYYIDILEGLIEPSTSSGVNYKELPLRWMLHNGYQVPEDMQPTAAALGMSPSSGSSHHVSEQSFAGELWQDVRCNVELRRDHIRRFFLKGSDMSNRRTPGVILQYRYFLGRIGKQRLREASLQATDYLILLVAGACLGLITKINDADFGAVGYSYTVIAMSLLCQIAALRSFSLDKLQYWRESASGMSSLAYFLAKDTVDHFNTLIKPVVYLSMFYFFTNPRSSFLDNYIILVFLVYCVTGMGYAFAIFFNPGPAQLFSVLLPVCLTLISTQSFNNTSLRPAANLCYPKWALEAFVISNAERYYGVWLITRCGALYKLHFSLHLWKYCILILSMFGVVSRVTAFIGLLTIQKK